MYMKSFFIFDPDQKPHQARIRSYSKSDFPELIQIQRECFPPPFPSELWWNEEQLAHHVQLFPEGAVCIEIAGNIAGSVTSLMIEFDEMEHARHTWAEATDNGYIRNHNPDGNTLYVVDISVRPAYRKWGAGKQLMQALYELVVHRNLDRLLGGGRMSGYSRYADRMDAEQYVQSVLVGRIQDPVLSFMLRCGRSPVAIVPDYLEDEESGHYGVLMEWKNPFVEYFPGKVSKTGS